MRKYDSLFTNLYDGLLVTSALNIYYLSGFRGTSGWLLLTKKACHLFTDFRYVEQAKRQAKGFIIHETKDLETLKDVIKSEKVTVLGFEDARMTVREFAYFKKLSCQFIPASDTILRARTVKSFDEIQKIKAAQKLTEEAFLHLLPQLRIGMTEREVAFILEAYVKTHGASAMSFDTIIASGENGAMPHAMPSDRRISDGDLVVMDFGCLYDGYCADMTRTVGIGNVSAQAREVYNIVLSAQLAALASARPGMTGHELDKVARDIIEAAGYGNHFGHSLGHGVGIEIHEAPTAAPRSDEVFAPGMFVTVEPGIYLPGQFGVRIEDLVLFTEDGIENLNSTSKELILID